MRHSIGNHMPDDKQKDRHGDRGCQIHDSANEPIIAAGFSADFLISAPSFDRLNAILSEYKDKEHSACCNQRTLCNPAA